jgi:hypothetical protein
MRLASADHLALPLAASFAIRDGFFNSLLGTTGSTKGVYISFRHPPLERGIEGDFLGNSQNPPSLKGGKQFFDHLLFP